MKVVFISMVRKVLVISLKQRLVLHKSETFHTQVVLGRAASSGSGEQANYLLPGR